MKIEIGYSIDDHLLFDLKFYDRDGAAVVQTRYDWVADDVNPYNIHTAS